MKNPDDIRQALIPSEGGTLLTIEVSAGSRVERFPTGYNPWRQAIGIHVKAQALEGRANKAIISLIADTFDLSKSSVQIVSGQTSTIKRIFIEGVSSDTLHSILVSLLS
ncbi:MAG: DUF167 domain-containing protein [Methanobacteriota archaeon]